MISYYGEGASHEIRLTAVFPAASLPGLLKEFSRIPAFARM
jgi:hypothetical protein